MLSDTTTTSMNSRDSVSMYENREVVCPPMLCSEEELFKYLDEGKKHWRTTHAILNEVTKNCTKHYCHYAIIYVI